MARVEDQTPHRQLTTLAGWRRFVHEVVAPPGLRTEHAWQHQSQAERLAYDEDRLNHHARLLVVATPTIRRANLTDVVEAVCGVCIDARTSLVAVNEIHNVPLATRTGAEASDMLKYFAERLPATFAYAGIDVERVGLLAGTRGEQIAGRFGMIRTAAFARGEHWSGLIAALEGSLRLHCHQPGTLVGLEGYLHRRTSGMIGSLLRLIRSAALQAVLDGSEQITRASLETIELDIAAEAATPQRRTTPRRGPARTP